MSKFIKRLSKVGVHFDTALVVGTAFGHLEDLLSKFNTVFVIADEHPNIRSKNLIYRNFKSDLNVLPGISIFFIDTKYNTIISHYTHVLTKSKPMLVIGDSDHLDRDHIRPLLAHGYKRVSKQYDYHFWKVNR